MGVIFIALGCYAILLVKTRPDFVRPLRGTRGAARAAGKTTTSDADSNPVFDDGDAPDTSTQVQRYTHSLACTAVRSLNVSLRSQAGGGGGGGGSTMLADTDRVASAGLGPTTFESETAR